MDDRIREIEESLKHPNFLTKQQNGLLLNKHQIEVLDRFKIPWQNYSTYLSLVYIVEEVLLEVENEDLEKIASELQEFSYYNEVKK